MKKPILATMLLAAGFGSAVCAEAAGTQASTVYQNFATVTVPPMIDASLFYNQGTFDFTGNLSVGFHPPFVTLDTMTYSNRGILSSAVALGWSYYAQFPFGASGATIDLGGYPVGFVFQNYTATRTQPAANFYNHGIISAQDAGVNFLTPAVRSYNDAVHFHPIPSLVRVLSANVTNDGVLSVGTAGTLQITGRNVDVSRGALMAGQLANQNLNALYQSVAFLNEQSLDSGRGFRFGGAVGNTVTSSYLTNHFNPVGVSDVYALVTNGYNLPASEFAIAPTGYDVYMYAFPDPDPAISTSLAGTNDEFVNLVFVQNTFGDTNITSEVLFNSSPNVSLPDLRTSGNDGIGYEAMVRFSTPVQDVITGDIVDNSFFLIDSGAMQTTFGVSGNGGDANGQRPSIYEVTTATPTEWLLGLPASAPFDTNAVAGGSFRTRGNVSTSLAEYHAVIGRNPETLDGSFPLDPFVSYFVPTITFDDPTNEPGRIEITATNLNMTSTRMRADGIVNIVAKHVQGLSAANSDYGIYNADLGRTNGTLVVSNFFPTEFHRLRGALFAESVNWDNVQTNATATNTIHFHALLVEHQLQATFRPSARSLSLRATNIVIQDDTRAIKRAVFNATNLTLNAALTLTGVASNLTAQTMPIKNLLIGPNGSLSVDNQALLGADTVSGWNSITNQGTITAVNPQLKAKTIENSGVISSLGNGSVILQGGLINLPGPSSQISSSADIQFTATTLHPTGSILDAGQSLIGKISLAVSGELSDLVPGVPGTNSVLTNFWTARDGFSLLARPAKGDLFGTRIQTIANGQNAQMVHLWAAADLGPTTNGFTNNAVIGHLTLDRVLPTCSTRFTAAGVSNAMYVDYLELADYSFSDYRNGLLIDPNLTIYFAAANVDALKLASVYTNRLVWVPNFMGPNSTTLVPRTDGTFSPMNSSLASSGDIDSDGDGIPNRYDPYPLDPINTPHALGSRGVSVDTSVAPAGVNSAVVSVAWTGAGTVTTSWGSKTPSLGSNYTVTAVAKPGNVFAGWSGSVSGAVAKVGFTLLSNTTFMATFIPNPFPAVKGDYSGLFYETNADGVQLATSGKVVFNVSAQGVVLGRLLMADSAYPFTGQLLGDGSAAITVPHGKSSLALVLQLDLSTNRTGVVSGSVARKDVWLAALLADRAAAAAGATPLAEAGRYTLILPGAADASANPGGDSYAVTTVSKLGTETTVGNLADGKAFTESSALSANGDWPFFVALPGGKEALLGWVRFDAKTMTLTNGGMSWIKSQAQVGLYRAGFTNGSGTTGVIGSLYTNPAPKTVGISWTNPVVVLSGGNLAVPVTEPVQINSKLFTAAGLNPSVVLTFHPAAGTFTGLVKLPGLGKPAVNGVLLQNQSTARGFFLGTNQSGAFLLQED